MWTARRLGPSLADDPPVANDDRADRWIRTRPTSGAVGQCQRAGHELRRLAHPTALGDASIPGGDSRQSKEATSGQAASLPGIAPSETLFALSHPDYTVGPG